MLRAGLASAMTKVSIIVPTLNESENVGPLVAKILETAIPLHEILFVDGNSTDSTAAVIQSLSSHRPTRLIVQAADAPGLAAAIMTGVSAAQGDVVVVMDSDLSHPPERIKDLLDPILAGTADLVIGSRYVPGGSTPGWPLWRRIMSRTASILAYPLTGVRDSMCGFFAISRSQLLKIAPPTSGFKILFETIVHGGSNLRVKEIPISFRDRAHGRSKMSFGIALRFFCRWLIALASRLLRH